MEAALYHLIVTDTTLMERARPVLMELDIEQVEADPDQARERFDPETIESLSRSLRSRGQLLAILAWHDEARGRYIIVDGERRYRAAKLAKLSRLKAEVWHYRPSPEEVALCQITIDHQRESLDPIEQAAAFRRVMDSNSWNASDLAREIHVSHTTVSRAVSLLELPEDLQALIRDRTLSPGVARELARIADAALRASAWAKVQAEEMTARQTQQFVTNLLKPKAKPRGPKPKGRYSYRNVCGYNVSITPRKIVLTATKSGRKPDEILAALQTLADRYREDVARAEVKSEANPGEGPAMPPPVEGSAT